MYLCTLAQGPGGTGMPAVFWYNNYEGGLGAAEKIFQQFDELLAASLQTVDRCTCTTLEGCPHCTHTGHCDVKNEYLSKQALRTLAALLQGREPAVRHEPFVYRRAQRRNGRQDDAASGPAGRGNARAAEEAETDLRRPETDPYRLLRVQPGVHDIVLEKAYEVRGREMMGELPPVSAVALQRAYQEIRSASGRPASWEIRPGLEPYRILQVLPSASLAMVEKIRRVIAFQLHPDRFPGDRQAADDMMKLVNEAFEKIRREMRQGTAESDPEAK